MRFSYTLLCIASMLIFAHSGTTEDTNSHSATDSEQSTEEFINGTKITSETMDLNMETSMIAFKNNVTVTDSKFTLKGDKLIIVSKGRNEVESLQAEGSVRLKTKNGEATCQKATYANSLGQFTLEHDVTLRQPKGNVSADRIMFLIQNGHIEGVHCEGNVRALIPSKEIMPVKRSNNP